jgi:hypothetical protein
MHQSTGCFFVYVPTVTLEKIEEWRPVLVITLSHFSDGGLCDKLTKKSRLDPAIKETERRQRQRGPLHFSQNNDPHTFLALLLYHAFG